MAGMFHNNDYRRIDDTSIGSMIGEDGNITPEGVDTIIDNLNDNIQTTLSEIQDLEFHNSYVYPISKNMYSDLNYHAKTHMFVNIHICPYQIRKSTDGTPFLQYILKKVTDAVPIPENEGYAEFLDFHKKSYFSGFHTGEVDLMKECIAMLKVIMASYRIFMKGDEGYSYTGFHRDDNTFYVFFDISPSWINHHYLSTNDSLWLSTIYEMTVVRQVGPFHVCSNVTKMFSLYDELNTLYKVDGEIIKTPIVGYSLEDKTHMEWTMNFGKQREAYGNGKHSNDEDGVFVYHFSYDSCLDSIQCSSDDEYKQEAKSLVVMRHLLFYENAADYSLYENDETHDNDGVDDCISENTLLVNEISDNSGVFVVRKFGNQTPLTSHNTLV